MLPIGIALLATLALGAGAAQAATPSYRSGNYYGTVAQTSPKPYNGKIHFVVREGHITHITYTVGAQCGGGLWTLDRDQAIPKFPIKISGAGAFSYVGTVASRLIRFKGSLTDAGAQGTFFQSFPWGQLKCSMSKAATFTASR